ncbi:hypothetical protein Hanom_Chr11g01054381 [Helianthus anomalus]
MEKGKEGVAEGDATEKVVTNVALRVVVQEVRLPHLGVLSIHVVTLLLLGGHGPSSSQQGPEFKKVEGGRSWLDHNPSCDNFPHVPHWDLTKGSHMDDLDNFHEVAEGEDKLAKVKQLSADRQKDWTAACERSNCELKVARDEVVKLKAEKDKESQEYECLVAAHKEKEAESQACIIALEKTVEEQKSQNRALELLAEKLGSDC